MSIKKTITIFLLLMAVLVAGYIYLKREIVDAVDSELKPKQYMTENCKYSATNPINGLDYQKCLKAEKAAILKEKLIEQEDIKISKIFVKNEGKTKEVKFTLENGKIIIDTSDFTLNFCMGNNLVGYIVNPASIELEPFSNNFNILCRDELNKVKVIAFYTDKSDLKKLELNIAAFSQQLNASKK